MNRTSMPLNCTICSSKPTFSDISHLLTHISSKQHLSNYFKIQVQSNGDDEAQAILDRYDAWYEKWNMSDLLKERMDQKAKKKSNANTSKRTNNIPQQSKNNKARVKPAQNVKTQSDEIRANHSIQSQYSQSYTPILQQAYGPIYATRPMFPTFPQWPESPSIKVEDEDSSDADAKGEQEQDLPSYPRRSQRNVYPYRLGEDVDDYSSGSEEADEEGPEAELSVKEGIKLKGVFWPGMDLFDSATPEMQRKRNQKKTTDVVAQLEATSKVVEPEEVIYDIDGELLAQREITGNPEINDTPLRGETTPEMSSPPPAKKRKTRVARKPRAALTERDENSSIGPRRSRRSHTSFGNKRRSTYLETSEDADDTITYQATQKKRAGLSIHRDNSGPDIIIDARMSQHPLSGYHHGMPGLENIYPSLPAQHSSTAFRANPYTTGGDRAQHLPSMHDLSGFGSLSHSFRPSLSSFQHLEPTRRPLSMHDTGPPLFNGVVPPLQGYGGTMHSMQSYPFHITPAYLSADSQLGLGLFQGMHTHVEDSNPIFWGDEQILPDEQSIKNASEHMKQEKDDDDETISLPEDEK